MKRRDFLRTTIPLGLAPLMVNGLPVLAGANPQQLLNVPCPDVMDRALVIIQLHGGVDMLNLLIPIDQYGQYANHRPNIGIPNSGTGSYITLDSTLPANQQLGLHPEMGALKNLYDAGMVNIVQGVNYPNNNKSHFRAINLWMSGNDSTVIPSDPAMRSGWPARFTDSIYPNYPNAYPNTAMPDPPILQFGSYVTSLDLQRMGSTPMGLTLLREDPADFYNTVNGTGTPAWASVPSSHYGSNLDFIQQTQQLSNNYAARLNSLYQAGSNCVTYRSIYHDPTVTSSRRHNRLYKQLQTVARMIKGGCTTKIFITRYTGWDTHSDQVEAGEPWKGWQAMNIYNLFSAIEDFQNDLACLNIADRVVTTTYSEFARDVVENASMGTDHGTDSSMFVIGSKVNGGVSGNNLDITNLVGIESDDMQHDYREVYRTVLEDWLGGDTGDLTDASMASKASMPDLFASANDATTGCYANALPVGLTYFDASLVDDRRVKLSWLTASEVNNSHFILSKSKDAETFVEFAKIKGNGTTEVEHSYTEFDSEPYDGSTYYLLTQVDFDGTKHRFPLEVVYIDTKGDSPITVGPNPARNFIRVQITSEVSQMANMSLYSLNGNLVRTFIINLDVGHNEKEFRISDMPAGMYALRISTPTGEWYSAKQLIATR